MGLSMITFANVQTPSINSLMLTHGCEDYGIRVGGHGFIIAKHEIPHFSQWLRTHLTQRHVRSSFPHHVHNESEFP